MARVLVLAIAVGLAMALGAASSQAQYAYITNSLGGTVSVIDTATNTVTGSAISVGNDPGGVAVSPDGTKVYVASFSNVSVIDTATNTVIGSPIVDDGGPFGIGVSPQWRYTLRRECVLKHRLGDRYGE
jgi:YVTN family beta-propeller protein